MSEASKPTIRPYTPEADAYIEEMSRERRTLYRDETWVKLDALGTAIKDMGAAMLDDDDILGVLASSAVADIMPRLPENIRHTFIDALSDESARSARADDAYETARFG